MILVDSSVWIASLRREQISQTARLRQATIAGEVLVGDLILLEVLQGARDEAHANRLEADLRTFPIASLLSDRIAVAAASNYRKLRTQGFTIRRTTDLIIGTYCLEVGHTLLHDDRDFDPMESVLGLLVA